MYLVVPSKSYKKSLEKLKTSGKLKKQAEDSLEEAIDILANGKKLPAEYVDHSLSGKYTGYRDCHIKGDLILVYKIQKKELVLFLVDIGTHASIFG